MDSRTEESFNMGKPVVTYSIVDLIAVKIRGEPHPDGFPIFPRDDGLVQRFQKWGLQENIFPIMGQFSGGGGLLAYYDPCYRKQIEDWFEREGAQLDHEKTWGGKNV